MTKKTNIHLQSSQLPLTLVALEEVLLANRQIQDKNEYFSPPRPSSFDYTTVGLNSGQLKLVVARIKKAIKSQEKVVVAGDYDADGICATAIMWQALYYLGLNVVPFIPHRTQHGYGLNEKSVEAILQFQPSLVVTVDNGIVAHRGLSLLAKAGVEVIVSDHHEKDAIGQESDNLLDTLATLHTTQLCGTTLAWFIAKYLLEKLPLPKNTKPDTAINKTSEWLDLCCLATFSDQMPLTGINRSFAYHGLQTLQQTTHVGLLALMDAAGIKQAEINEYTVQFGIVPRLNALGRLEHGMEVLRLLCTKDPAKAKERAQVLNLANQKRQELTTQMLATAQDQARSQADQKLLVIADTSFHEGIIGLLAGKLTEQFRKPTIVLAIGPETAKGSARSLGAIDITALLRQVQSLLTEVGGHRLAAGCSLPSQNMDEFKETIQMLANKQIKSSDLDHQTVAECELPSELINLAAAKLIQKFAPFGTGNREPIFLVKDLKLTNSQTLGAEGKHLKLLFTGQHTQTQAPVQFEAMHWQNGHKLEELKTNPPTQILVRLQINKWNGREKVQVAVV